MKLTPCSPIGSTLRPAFVDGPERQGLMNVLTDDYRRCAQAEQIHLLRLERSVNLRDLAHHLGIKASELSGLEFGKFTTDAEGWNEIRAAIHQLSISRGDGGAA